jgi:hypothetical protein
MKMPSQVHSSMGVEPVRLQPVKPPAPPVDLKPAQDLMRLAWRKGKDHFPCNTGRERSLKGSELVHAESFTAMIIADLLVDHCEGQPEQASMMRDILNMLERELGDESLFYFFKEHERLPADADCTAVGLSVLLRGGASGPRIRKTAHKALDKILNNVNEAGVVETYFDPTGERAGIVDAVVCCNVLFLAHQLNRGTEARATLEYVHRVLVEESFLDGTRYYHSPDTFLYFLGRLVHCFPADTEELLLEPLKAAIRKRIGVSSHTVDVAQRALLCAWFMIDDEGEGQRLLEAREGDGCWANDALFRYGRKKVYFGSRVMATAFAVTAVVEAQKRAEVVALVEDVDVADDEPGAPVTGTDDNVTFVRFGRG